MTVTNGKLHHVSYGKCDCFEPNPIKDERTGYLLCNQCGIVLDESRFDKGPDWRAFTKAEYEKRATSEKMDDNPTTLNEIYKIDARGKKIPPGIVYNMKRQKKWYKDSIKRTYDGGKAEIGRLCSILGKGDNVAKASYKYFKHAVDNKLLTGRSIDGMAAAAFELACRVYKSPVIKKEVEKNSREKKRKVIRSSYRVLLNEVHYKRLNLAQNLNLVKTPQQFTGRFIDDLGLPVSFEKKVNEVLNIAVKMGISQGKVPEGFTAGAIYLIQLMYKEDYKGKPRTQKEIAKVAKVTEVTLRSRYKELVKKLNLNFPTRITRAVTGH